MLGYADGLRDSGNGSDAMPIYKTMLSRSEEHLQCAALVGIGKMKTPDAASAIYPLLEERQP